MLYYQIGLSSSLQQYLHLSLFILNFNFLIIISILIIMTYQFPILYQLIHQIELQSENNSMSEDGDWPTDDETDIHQYGLTATWCILFNITVILSIIKHSPLAAKLHFFIGLVMFFTTYFFILWLLGPYGFLEGQKDQILFYLHAIFGCAMLGFVVLQVSSGLITSYYLNSKALGQKLKIYIKIFHKSLAYFLAVLFKLNIIWNWYSTEIKVFVLLIVWEALTISIWFYLKFFRAQLQGGIEDYRLTIVNQNSVPLIHKHSQVKNISYPYIIYNNFVYDATNLAETHPGGKKVIESIIGREVDRFLYGMYSSQLCPEVPSHSHSRKALALINQPKFKIVNKPVFRDFTQSIASVRVQFINEVSKKTKIYILGLQKLEGEFRYEGYTELSQLGQYYSLTMNDKITRLYTTVNFLSKVNIQLINRLMPEINYNIKLDGQGKSSEVQKINHSLSLTSSRKGSLLESNYSLQNGDYLPIMLKIYEGGKLTSQVLTNNLGKFDLELSQQKGLGLELQNTQPGKVVVVAGGTGLFPFSDLIDLLFKDTFMRVNSTNNRIADSIYSNNAILKQKPFDRFSFTFLIAVNYPEDIHPITMAQLSYISNNSDKAKIVLRVNRDAESMQKGNKIELTMSYFSQRVISEAKANNFSKVWICGPPKMATDTAETLLSNNFPRNSFLLL